MIHTIPFSDVSLSSGFWADRHQVNRNLTLSAVYHQTDKTYRFESLKGDWTPQEKRYRPHVFWDSDIAKWIEAGAYTMATHPSHELETQLDDIIDRFEALQQEDGYLNSYFTQVEPNKRWSNLRDLHELYCAGHLIEAAVAYYEATGKRKLLDVMCRYVDYIATVFGTDDGQRRGYPGHQEIELALVRLYQATGEGRYLDLATYFIDERGQQPHYYDDEALQRGQQPEQFWARSYAYNQSHQPVRDQTTLEGHAVRACYMVAGMADIARLKDDESLKQACQTLWDDVVNHKLYITGALGSTRLNEGFTSAYDLPDETAYAETCASISLIFWAQRMFLLDPDSRYIDVMERALYNGFLSGLSLDGTQFFYSNPLASHPSIDPFNVWTPVLNTDGAPYQRLDWYDCACCPGNIARLIASIGGYFYVIDDDRLYVNLYGQNTAQLHMNDTLVQITQSTDYPWYGSIQIQIDVEDPCEFELALRIPDWCQDASLMINGKTVDMNKQRGYATIKRQWTSQTIIQLDLPMPIERIRANPKVRQTAGQVALQRGPTVYCLEEFDNDENLNAITIPKSTELTAEYKAELLGGVVSLTGQAKRHHFADVNQLYQSQPPETEAIVIKAIPFCFWANRGAGEMRVWIRESE